MLRGKPPFREYALPLKRERWHAKRAGEGATCQGTSAEPQNDTCIVARNPIFGYALPSKRERCLARDDSVITLFLFGDAGFAKFDKVFDLHLSDISLRPVANGNFARSRFLLADYEHIRNTF